MNDEMMSIEQTANMLSVHTRTIRRYLKSGTLKGVKIGGKWHIRRDDIVKMLNRSDVSEELESTWNSQAVDFIQGAPAPIGSRFRVCAITDCDFHSDEEAATVSSQLLGVINSRDSATSEARFQYNYHKEAKQGRFILWGDPEFIRQCMQILEKKGEEK